MWRARSMNFSMYSVASPNAACASLAAELISDSSSLSSRTMRMPRPPPPAVALISTG